MHAKKSVLVNSDNYWRKKTSDNYFDITMGSYDGAETCELVGSYLLHQIANKYKHNFGLYRDDGLGIVQGAPREVEIIKKGLCELFQKHKLKITIDANKRIVNFLDVTLNLNNGKHSPYIKPGNIPLYVHRQSNHPPSILKNIPAAINKRLSDISSDQDTFNTAVPIYQKKTAGTAIR